MSCFALVFVCALGGICLVEDPKVLIGTPLSPPRESARSRALAPDANQAWRWIGWFSLVLTLAGLFDWVLAWIPLRFGSAEWEFATIVTTISALPLVTMGLAGLAASAMARGIRWQLLTVGSVVILWGLVIAAALLIFALDVPIALKTVQGPAHLGILKAIVKTLALGGLFLVAYLVIGIGALRRSTGSRK